MTHRHHETCAVALGLIGMMSTVLKRGASSLAGGLGSARVGVIDVVGIRTRLVGIVIVNEASLFLMRHLRAGQALRVRLDQAPEL